MQSENDISGAGMQGITRLDSETFRFFCGYIGHFKKAIARWWGKERRSPGKCYIYIYICPPPHPMFAQRAFCGEMGCIFWSPRGRNSCPPPLLYPPPPPLERYLGIKFGRVRRCPRQVGAGWSVLIENRRGLAEGAQGPGGVIARRGGSILVQGPTKIVMKCSEEVRALRGSKRHLPKGRSWILLEFHLNFWNFSRILPEFY